jgi:hypothetical protein
VARWPAMCKLDGRGAQRKAMVWVAAQPVGASRAEHSDSLLRSQQPSTSYKYGKPHEMFCD